MIQGKGQGREPIYEESLKIAVAIEYLTGPLGATKLARKHGIEKPETVRHFVRWYKKHFPNTATNTLAGVEPAPATQPAERKADIHTDDAVYKQLQEANLKIAALQTMISIASKELGVDIAKKHGAKQSGK